MTINLGRHLLYYNKRLFGEAGLDENNPPRTHSEWEQAARLLTRMDPDGTYSQRGIDMVTNNNERNFRLFETLTEQWDAQLFNPFTRAALPFLERNIQVAEWMLDFQQSLGPVNPSGASEGRPPFTNEQVAMYMGIDGDWFNFAQGSPHIDVGMSALPVPDGEPLRSVVVPGWGWGISSDTKHPELAWELLKWLSVDPDGGGWFIRQQGRMSSVPENNLDPEYFDVHAYWNVVIDVANAGIPFLPRCTLDLGTGELNGILGGALTKAGAGEASVRGLLEDAQRVLQARCDGAS